jgi:NADH-quinone oxidoreductase subunit E
MSESKTVHLPPEPEGAIPEKDLFFSEEELKQVERYKSMYPTSQGAVMRVLWMAQEKFGYLPPEVIRLVADTLEIPYALVFGVSTFYTQYYKEPVGKYVLDVCTCFACQVVGGYDVFDHLCDRLGIQDGETSDDGLITLRQAECLGACGSGPMLQVANGPYVYNLTPERIDALIEDLKEGRLPEFVSITLPQDEDEMGGNRRTDVDNVDTYKTQPVAQRFS